MFTLLKILKPISMLLKSPSLSCSLVDGISKCHRNFGNQHRTSFLKNMRSNRTDHNRHVNYIYERKKPPRNISCTYWSHPMLLVGYPEKLIRCWVSQSGGDLEAGRIYPTHNHGQTGTWFVSSPSKPQGRPYLPEAQNHIPFCRIKEDIKFSLYGTMQYLHAFNHQSFWLSLGAHNAFPFFSIADFVSLTSYLSLPSSEQFRVVQHYCKAWFSKAFFWSPTDIRVDNWN